jgi:hypothetical protein
VRELRPVRRLMPQAMVHLVEMGDPSRNILPCAACHRPGSGGPIEAPFCPSKVGITSSCS